MRDPHDYGWLEPDRINRIGTPAWWYDWRTLAALVVVFAGTAFFVAVMAYIVVQSIRWLSW